MAVDVKVAADAAPPQPLAAGAPRPERKLRLPLAVRLLLLNPKSAFGIGLLATIVIVRIGAPLLAHQAPNEPDYTQVRHSPSWRFPFGTTDQGYNVFSQVLYGGRMSLGVAASAAIIALAISVTLGLLAAYRGGRM